MKRSNYATIIMMTVVLFVVIALMIVANILKSPLPDTPLSTLTGDAGMVKHRYYNKPFRCVVSLPDTNNWHPLFNTQIDSQRIEHANESHPLRLLRLERRDDGMVLAKVDVGVFKVSDTKTLKAVAETRKNALVDSLRQVGESVAIIGDVAVVSSLSLASAFFALEIAVPTPAPYPILVTMLVPRGERMYQITSWVKRVHYEFLRSEIEYILINFQML